ncbi:hypothetical protein ACP70R_036724 [Stipagrostis hirtigluma subsp. patula]
MEPGDLNHGMDSKIAPTEMSRNPNVTTKDKTLGLRLHPSCLWHWVNYAFFRCCSSCGHLALGLLIQGLIQEAQEGTQKWGPDTPCKEGIPSVGMSPFACGWSTHQRNLASANASQIIQSLHAGFVPVLHGDAVLDELLDCTILSGDVIIRRLAQLLSPKYVVFLTDVHGVYDRPPSDPNAVLLREIEVDDNGSWSIVKPASVQGDKKGVKISVAAHDTTGGMETKILEAAMIARLGIDVYITKVGTEHSLRALKGDVSTGSEDWLGTVIRSCK